MKQKNLPQIEKVFSTKDYFITLDNMKEIKIFNLKTFKLKYSFFLETE